MLPPLSRGYTFSTSLAASWLSVCYKLCVLVVNMRFSNKRVNDKQLLYLISVKRHEGKHKRPCVCVQVCVKIKRHGALLASEDGLPLVEQTCGHFNRIANRRSSHRSAVDTRIRNPLELPMQYVGVKRGLIKWRPLPTCQCGFQCGNK